MTNERKNMSTKTLRKRIALVAVTALTAGLVSVVGTPAANAGATDNATTAANTLQLAIKASTTGSVITSSTAEDNSTNRNFSVGLLAVGTGTGTTQTAVMLNTGSLAFYTGAPTTAAVFVAEGGTFSSLVGAGGTPALALSSDRTKAYSAASTQTAVAFTPNAGVTTATVYLYTGSATLANPGAGTLVGQNTITVTTADATGVYSSTYSKIKADNANMTASTSVPSSNTDGTTSIVNGGVGYIGVNLKDAFAQTLGSGALIATATNNVQVEWGAVSATSTSVAVYTTYSYATLQVKQGTANKNKPVTTTVSFTYNGTAVGSKTLTFWGEATKIDVYNVVTSNLGTANPKGDYVPAGANFKVYDAAGNWIQEPTSQAVVLDSTTTTSNVTAVTVTRVSDPLADNGAYFGNSGRLTWTCAATASGKSADIKVYTLNASNQKVYGTFKAACSGSPYTFKASTDKAVYAPGEIITVTLTGYDLAGNLANDRTEIGEGVSTVKPVIASGAIASAVDTPAATDVATKGQWKYRFIAAQDEGTYSISAYLPNGSGDGAATLPVTIKSTSTAVSNADVLKAIVSLIASINKQIAALQKALLKK